MPIEKVYQLVMKAIAQLPATMAARDGSPVLTPAAYLTKLTLIISRTMPIIRNYIKTDAGEHGALIGLEELSLEDKHSLTGSKGFSPTVMAKVIISLYDSDVLKEESILSWYTHPSDEIDEKFSKQQQNELRREGAVKKMYDWFCESDDEDSE